MKASLCMKLRWSMVREEKDCVVVAGDYSHGRFGQEEVRAVRVARCSGGD